MNARGDREAEEMTTPLPVAGSTFPFPYSHFGLDAVRHQIITDATQKGADPGGDIRAGQAILAQNAWASATQWTLAHGLVC
jgi:hypothetical protein